MRKLSAWLNAARLRTLPLSVAGVLVGTALANFYGRSNVPILVLALLTAIGFQITSNFANDYGDGVKGADNDERIGPQRALQSGLLTPGVLKKGIIVSIIINIILVAFLVYLSFDMESIGYIFLFMILGGISIWAAVRYTMGESAYGYKGLGDVFVFVFFGLLAVLGTLFLFTKSIDLMSLLPAVSLGALSTGVLNLNNLRDHKSDKNAGKNTLVVKMGYSWGISYHMGLLFVGLCGMSLFVIMNFKSLIHFMPLLAFIPILIHARKVYCTKDPAELDPELKKLAISIFMMALLFYISNNIFL